MKKPKKVLLVFAALLLFFIIAAAVISTIPISSSRLESALMLRAGEMLGMPVASDGLTIRLNRGLIIRNPALGEPGAPLLTAKSITVRVNLLRLIRRQLDIESLIIEKPVITIGEDGFFMPPMLPAEAEDAETGFQFSLKRAEIRDGKLISVRREEPPVIIAGSMFITASSVEAGGPINISAKADILGEIRLKAAARMKSAREPAIDLNAALTVPWDRIGSAAAEAGFKPAKDISGLGESIFNIKAEGPPENIDITLSGDITDAEVSFGEIFVKPGGDRAVLSAAASLAYPLLLLEEASLILGESVFDAEGRASLEELTARLKGRGNLDLENAAGFIPPASNLGAAGAAEISITMTGGSQEPFSAGGECRIKNWRLSAAGGDSLDFEFKASEGQLNIKNVRGRIGEGSLTGYGLIREKGEYEFTIEGVDINLEELIKTEDEASFQATGSAGLAASIRSSGSGIEKMSGSGNFLASDGEVYPPRGAERLLGAANLSALTPLKYERIRAKFMMESGVLNADASMKGEKLEIETEKAEFDFTKMKKRVYADLMLSPSFMENGRAGLGDLDKLLYFDERGYAHIGLVWDGDISDTSPNMGESLIRTGQKRLRERLRR